MMNDLISNRNWVNLVQQCEQQLIDNSSTLCVSGFTHDVSRACDEFDGFKEVMQPLF